MQLRQDDREVKDMLSKLRRENTKLRKRNRKLSDKCTLLKPEASATNAAAAKNRGGIYADESASNDEALAAMKRKLSKVKDAARKQKSRANALEKENLRLVAEKRRISERSAFSTSMIARLGPSIFLEKPWTA